MHRLIRCSEAEEHGVAAELTQEDGAHRHASSRARVDRSLAVELGENLTGGTIAPLIRRNQIRPRSAAFWRARDFNPGLLIAIDMVLNRSYHLVRLLIGDKPASDLGVRLTWKNRLRPLALEATEDAVDLQRGPCPLALYRAVTCLAEEILYAELSFVRLLVEGNLRHQPAIFVGQWHNVVIEAFDKDVALFSSHRVKQSNQRVDRVLNRSPIRAGVQIPAG